MCRSRTDGNSSVMQKSSSSSSIQLSKASHFVHTVKMCGKKIACTQGEGQRARRVRQEESRKKGQQRGEQAKLDYDYSREYCEKRGGHAEIVEYYANDVFSSSSSSLLLLVFYFILVQFQLSSVWLCTRIKLFCPLFFVRVAFIFAIRIGRSLPLFFLSRVCNCE